MPTGKNQFQFKRPRFIHFLIAFLLALVIMDRGAAYLYGPKAGSKDIFLYTTTWCGYCEALRLHLKAYNIPYIERDVEKSLAGAAGRWTLGNGIGVPVSVIGEQVVYGYDLEKINAALRQLGYTIKAPEPSLETTWDAGGNATPQAATTDCVPAEQFPAFYTKFKDDDDFRIQRTRFPLKRRLLSGAPPYRTTDEISEIEKQQVLTGQELVYLDYTVIDTGGYTENIYTDGGDSRVEVVVEETMEPLTIHKFQKVSGCWFLVEYVSYEYFGSMMILGSLHEWGHPST